MAGPDPVPLLHGRSLDAPLAWRQAEAVPARTVLAWARALERALPACEGVLNLCTDRLDFTITWLAAALRGVPSLMPPNTAATTLEPLVASHGRLAVVGEAFSGPGLTPVAWPSAPAASFDDALPTVASHLCGGVLLTSGSTGTPVPHARSMRSVQLNAQAQAERLCEMLGRASLEGLTLVATVPPQHSYGFESSVTLALFGGAALEAGRPFYPADIADALARVPRPRALVTTPFHLKTLLASGIELPPVDLVMCATAPLSPQLAVQAEQALGGPLIEVYGCTEAGQVATRRTTQTAVWHTYGELRVRAQRASGDGSDDVFLVQGGHVFDPTALADRLELHDDAHFELMGRTGDLISVAGKRSSISHLNHHLNSVPGVVDGACWMPLEEPADGIVRPVAFVVAPGLTAAQIAAALRLRLDPVFVPRRIVHLDRLPREATGKLTAATLAALAQAHLKGPAP